MEIVQSWPVSSSILLMEKIAGMKTKVQTV